MSCRLDGAKPLSEPMLEIVDCTLRNKLQANLKLKFAHFFSRKCIWKCFLKNGVHSRPQCISTGALRATHLNIILSEGDCIVVNIYIHFTDKGYVSIRLHFLHTGVNFDGHTTEAPGRFHQLISTSALEVNALPIECFKVSIALPYARIARFLGTWKQIKPASWLSDKNPLSQKN